MLLHVCDGFSLLRGVCLSEADGDRLLLSLSLGLGVGGGHLSFFCESVPTRPLSGILRVSYPL